MSGDETPCLVPLDLGGVNEVMDCSLRYQSMGDVPYDHRPFYRDLYGEKETQWLQTTSSLPPPALLLPANEPLYLSNDMRESQFPSFDRRGCSRMATYPFSFGLDSYDVNESTLFHPSHSVLDDGYYLDPLHPNHNHHDNHNNSNYEYYGYGFDSDYQDGWSNQLEMGSSGYQSEYQHWDLYSPFVGNLQRHSFGGAIHPIAVRTGRQDRLVDYERDEFDQNNRMEGYPKQPIREEMTGWKDGDRASSLLEVEWKESSSSWIHGIADGISPKDDPSTLRFSEWIGGENRLLPSLDGVQDNLLSQRKRGDAQEFVDVDPEKQEDKSLIDVKKTEIGEDNKNEKTILKKEELGEKNGVHKESEQNGMTFAREQIQMNSKASKTSKTSKANQSAKKPSKNPKPKGNLSKGMMNEIHSNPDDIDPVCNPFPFSFLDNQSPCIFRIQTQEEYELFPLCD